MALADIRTFVIVMMENRSFDHLCGYLSLPSAGPPMPVDGLRDDTAWRDRYINDDQDGTPRPIHRLDAGFQNITDPPHEDVDIAVQLDTPTHGGRSPRLGGFVKSYWNAQPRPADRSPVMGYYTKEAVPVFDFFARHFAICDHWFSPLPAGTQPNRLMAMSGESRIHHNVSDPLEFPTQPLVYDWLSGLRRSWCSYQWGGLPFFALMPRWWGSIVAGHNDEYQTGLFRRWEAFTDQWRNKPEAVPEVVFIEPRYTDDPTFSLRRRNDDHCPTGIAAGQKFLAEIYNTITANKSLWRSTMLIVTYDEHGGFFDHVEPPDIPASAGGRAFKTAGVRVPAFVVSPYVHPGSVFSDVVDSTSILQLLADRYTPGKAYSPAVAARQKYLKPLSAIITDRMAIPEPPPIPVLPAFTDGPLLAGAPATRLDTGTPSNTAQAFARAAEKMEKMHPDQFDRLGLGAQS